MARQKGVSLEWFQHCESDAEKIEFEKTLRNNGFVLDKLIRILENRLQSIDRDEMSRNSYDSPSWAFLQAHQNGRREGLTEVLSLLSFLRP